MHTAAANELEGIFGSHHEDVHAARWIIIRARLNTIASTADQEIFSLTNFWQINFRLITYNLAFYF